MNAQGAGTPTHLINLQPQPPRQATPKNPESTEQQPPPQKVQLSDAAKERAMKAKAYIESKYKKLSDEERERREGNRGC